MYGDIELYKSYKDLPKVKQKICFKIKSFGEFLKRFF